MALFIVGSYKATPYDPDSAFDPDTHIATEAAFIQLLQHGVYDSKYIGYKVQLGNSVDYNNGLWVIADVNHNAGQPNTYDLISQDCFHSGTFGSNIWRNSTFRTWLNNTFYPGFSTEFKNHVSNITYDSNGSTYNDDKIILPSFTEVNGITGTSATNFVVEGTAYPIFTDNNSRKKYQTGTTSYGGWWTRSRHTYYNGYVWYVGSNGSMCYDEYGYNSYLAPLMRVH